MRFPGGEVTSSIGWILERLKQLAQNEATYFVNGKMRQTILKDGVMLTALREKFGQNADLAEMLLLTDGFELIEFAPWGDTYWGVDKNKVGRNMLGKLLMIVRDELKEKANG